MLIVGDFSSIPYYRENMCVLNLSSLFQGFERVSLAPSVQPMLNDEKNFDLAYANYIFSNDDKFMEFMKIMMNLYMNIDVYLLVSRGEDTYDIVTESLCKLIQQRYGYNYQMINTVDDINEYDQSGFSTSGIQIMDQDKERFVQLAAQRGMCNDTNGQEVLY